MSKWLPRILLALAAALLGAAEPPAATEPTCATIVLQEEPPLLSWRYWSLSTTDYRHMDAAGVRAVIDYENMTFTGGLWYPFEWTFRGPVVPFWEGVPIVAYTDWPIDHDVKVMLLAFYDPDGDGEVWVKPATMLFGRSIVARWDGPHLAEPDQMTYLRFDRNASITGG
jgi:hypothetical protein